MSDLKKGDVIGGRFEVTSDGPIATWVVGRDARCGGSHYHCTRCGAVTSMVGHPSSLECERARERGEDDPDWVGE